MAGRILPIALASVAGVAIGVATFDGELKAQRKAKLEEDYKREVTVVSALNSDGPSPMASSAIKSPALEQTPAREETAKTSKLSSLLGFWAWKPHDSGADTTRDTLPPKPAAQTKQEHQPPQQKT